MMEISVVHRKYQKTDFGRGRASNRHRRVGSMGFQYISIQQDMSKQIWHLDLAIGLPKHHYYTTARSRENTPGFDGVRIHVYL